MYLVKVIKEYTNTDNCKKLIYCKLFKTLTRAQNAVLKMDINKITGFKFNDINTHIVFYANVDCVFPSGNVLVWEHNFKLGE